MEKVEDKNTCFICRTKLSPSTKFKLRNGFEVKTVIWEEKCAETICDIFFGDPSHPLKIYFQNAAYCGECQVIIWNLEFSWRQLLFIRNQVDNLSLSLRKLLMANYRAVPGKTKIIVPNLEEVHFYGTYTYDEVIQILRKLLRNGDALSGVNTPFGRTPDCADGDVRSQERNRQEKASVHKRIAKDEEMVEGRTLRSALKKSADIVDVPAQVQEKVVVNNCKSKRKRSLLKGPKPNPSVDKRRKVESEGKKPSENVIPLNNSAGIDDIEAIKTTDKNNSNDSISTSIVMKSLTISLRSKLQNCETLKEPVENPSSKSNDKFEAVVSNINQSKSNCSLRTLRSCTVKTNNLAQDNSSAVSEDNIIEQPNPPSPSPSVQIDECVPIKDETISQPSIVELDFCDNSNDLSEIEVVKQTEFVVVSTEPESPKRQLVPQVIEPEKPILNKRARRSGTSKAKVDSQITADVDKKKVFDAKKKSPRKRVSVPKISGKSKGKGISGKKSSKIKESSAPISNNSSSKSNEIISVQDKKTLPYDKNKTSNVNKKNSEDVLEKQPVKSKWTNITLVMPSDSSDSSSDEDENISPSNIQLPSETSLLMPNLIDVIESVACKGIDDNNQSDGGGYMVDVPVRTPSISTTTASSPKTRTSSGSDSRVANQSSRKSSKLVMPSDSSSSSEDDEEIIPSIKAKSNSSQSPSESIVIKSPSSSLRNKLSNSEKMKPVERPTSKSNDPLETDVSSRNQSKSSYSLRTLRSTMKNSNINNPLKNSSEMSEDNTSELLNPKSKQIDISVKAVEVIAQPSMEFHFDSNIDESCDIEVVEQTEVFVVDTDESLSRNSRSMDMENISPGRPKYVPNPLFRPNVVDGSSNKDVLLTKIIESSEFVSNNSNTSNFHQKSSLYNAGLLSEDNIQTNDVSKKRVGHECSNEVILTTENEESSTLISNNSDTSAEKSLVNTEIILSDDTNHTNNASKVNSENVIKKDHEKSKGTSVNLVMPSDNSDSSSDESILPSKIQMPSETRLLTSSQMDVTDQSINDDDSEDVHVDVSVCTPTSSIKRTSLTLNIDDDSEDDCDIADISVRRNTSKCTNTEILFSNNILTNNVRKPRETIQDSINKDILPPEIKESSKLVSNNSITSPVHQKSLVYNVGIGILSEDNIYTNNVGKVSDGDGSCNENILPSIIEEPSTLISTNSDTSPVHPKSGVIEILPEDNILTNSVSKASDTDKMYSNSDILPTEVEEFSKLVSISSNASPVHQKLLLHNTETLFVDNTYTNVRKTSDRDGISNKNLLSMEIKESSAVICINSDMPPAHQKSLVDNTEILPEDNTHTNNVSNRDECSDEEILPTENEELSPRISINSESSTAHKKPLVYSEIEILSEDSSHTNNASKANSKNVAGKDYEKSKRTSINLVMPSDSSDSSSDEDVLPSKIQIPSSLPMSSQSDATDQFTNYDVSEDDHTDASVSTPTSSPQKGTSLTLNMGDNYNSEDDGDIANVSVRRSISQSSTSSPEKRTSLTLNSSTANQSSPSKIFPLVMPNDSSGSSSSEDDVEILPAKNTKTTVNKKAKTNLTKRRNAGKHSCLVYGCKKSFKTTEELVVHFRVAHGRGHTPYHCLHPGCPKRFTSAAKLAAHTKIHQIPTSFKCKECWKTFQTEESLEIHKEKHDAGMSFNCVMCFTTFPNVKLFKAHMASVHTATSENTKVANSHSSRSFSTDKNLSLPLHIKSHKELPRVSVLLKCTVCGMICADKLSFENHKKAHANGRPFSCQICGASFAWKYRLETHLEVAHLGQKPAVCNICGQVCKSQIDLNVHKSKHVKREIEIEIVCKICGDSFESQSSLENHTSMVHCDENENSEDSDSE